MSNNEVTMTSPMLHAYDVTSFLDDVTTPRAETGPVKRVQPAALVRDGARSDERA